MSAPTLTAPLDTVHKDALGYVDQIRTHRKLMHGSRIQDGKGREFIVESRWMTGADSVGTIYMYELTDVASLGR
ncbi:hypothetical protein [Leifsonia sp. Leaf264]|uniref:hypothetical protein n=1 Tax=Leifsonia sp. Leaf264 TaxID=1736314 RepID=UPI0006FE7BA4|nr:hypothetical protein [Leifsonia sp. Leaf264]KQO98389.1 hypothetical protein ASF30_10030 [Leifsonia sp. Leaf264]